MNLRARVVNNGIVIFMKPPLIVAVMLIMLGDEFYLYFFKPKRFNRAQLFITRLFVARLSVIFSYIKSVKCRTSAVPGTIPRCVPDLRYPRILRYSNVTSEPVPAGSIGFYCPDIRGEFPRAYARC